MVISPALRKEGILPASRCDLMMRQPRLRCRYVRPNEKKASGRPLAFGGTTKCHGSTG